MRPKVAAIFCADLHWSHMPPIFRSNEPDWYKAMLRPIKELTELQKKYMCPIFCAGDIVDKWNSPPELINFLIDNLVHMYTIAGQHDLPEHDIKQIERSAYWTLARSGRITHINTPVDLDIPVQDKEAFVFPFHYGESIQPPKKKDIFNIAMIHEYCWIPGHSYKSAPEESNILSTNSKSRFEGWDLVVSGDNHSGFMSNLNGVLFVNCGSFMCRHSIDVHVPKVWLLYSDGSVQQHCMDQTKDCILPTQEVFEKLESLDADELIKELIHLGVCAVDFSMAVEHHLSKHKDISKGITKILRKAMEIEHGQR